MMNPQTRDVPMEHSLALHKHGREDMYWMLVDAGYLRERAWSRNNPDGFIDEDLFRGITNSLGSHWYYYFGRAIS